MRRGSFLTAVLVVLVLASFGTVGADAKETPSTVAHEWTVRWPEKGKTRTLIKRFKAPPGLIRRVRVFIGGESVPGPPHIAIVACKTSRQRASAQRAWLWDGRRVYVALLLDPARCRVAGTSERVRVVLTSAGT